MYNSTYLTEELNKKLKIVRLFKDKNTKKNYFIACTDNKVFKQDIREMKSFKLIFDAKDNFGKITDIFEVPKFVNNNKNIILLATSERLLIELDVDKLEQHNDNCLVSFLTKSKQEGKTKVIKYEINYTNKYTHSYFVFLSLDETKNPRSVLKYDDKHNIITCKFRPRNPMLRLNNNQFLLKNPRAKLFVDHNHLAISFGNNTLYIQHYESKCHVMEYVSYYGNFTCLEYTADGKLLAAGTESDHVFIIDCELNSLLYTLEGHKNYVSQIMFFENVTPDIEDLGLLCKLDSMTSTTGQTSGKTGNNGNVDMNEINSTSLGSNSNNINQSTPQQTPQSTPQQNLKRRKSSIRIPIQEISIDQMRSLILKENFTKQDYLNIDFLRHSRTTPNENTDNNDETKLFTTYDILTTGLDGYVGVWRIEYYYDELKFNEKNYSEFVAYSSNYTYCRIDNITSVQLFPKDKTKISYSNLTKISNNPIIKIIYNENFFVFVTKKVSTGGIIYLKIYNGVTKVEEIIETNFLTQGNLNEEDEDMITERYKLNSKVSQNSYSNNIPNNTPSKLSSTIPKTSSQKNSKKNLNTVANESSDRNNSPIPSYSDNKRKLSSADPRKKSNQKDNSSNVKK